MTMASRIYLDFNDVRIIPNTGTNINTRVSCDTKTKIGRIELDVPVIVPSMRVLVSQDLIWNVENCGGMVIQPRNEYFASLRPAFNSSLDTALKVAEKLITLHNENAVLSIEIANGHMQRMAKVISQVKKEFPTLPIWAGTVAN